MAEVTGEGVELRLDGITGKQFLAETFEFEFCSECGQDADQHTAIALGLGAYGTNWFARCDMPEIEESQYRRDLAENVGIKKEET